MLKVVGEFNKLSAEMLATVPELKKGQKVRFRLLEFDQDPATKEKLFGGIVTFNCLDRVLDIGTKKIVDIGIPKDIKDNLVTRCKKFVLSGGGPGGQVAEIFELHQGRIEDEQLYHFFSLCNINKSNKNRDTTFLPRVEMIDDLREAKKGATKRASLLDALIKAQSLKNEEILRFAAAMNWDVAKDIELLREDVGAYAQSNSADFLARIKSGTESIKALLKLAQAKEIIQFDPIAFKWIWVENGAVIAKLDKDGDKNELDLFAEWVVATKNGNNVFEAIKGLYDEKVAVEINGTSQVDEDNAFGDNTGEKETKKQTQKKGGGGKKATGTAVETPMVENTQVTETGENGQDAGDEISNGSGSDSAFDNL